jgi:hypothetical protein
MRRCSSVHILLLGTILDARNKFLGGGGGEALELVRRYSHLPRFSAIGLSYPATKVLTLKLTQKDTTLTTTI